MGTTTGTVERNCSGLSSRETADPQAAQLHEETSYALLRQKVATLPSQRSEDLADHVQKFHKALEASDLYERFEALTGGKPALLLSDGVIENLRQLNAPERLALLALAGQSLKITPLMLVERYFMEFPEDLQTVAAAFREARGMHTEYENELELFSLSMPALVRSDLVSADSSPYRKALNHHLEQARRRSTAAERLMDAEPGELRGRGEAGAQFEEQLCLARRVARYRNDITEPELAFEGVYTELNSDQQSALLRGMVAAVHNSIVAHDCRQSAITQKFVEQHNAEVQAGRGPQFRAGHSTVYPIEHALPIFEGNWEFLMQPMFEPESVDKPVDRFPLQRLMRHTLSQFDGLKASEEERRKNCDCLIEFWHKNRDPLYGAVVAQALSHQDPHYAAAGMLSLIRDSSGYRSHLSSVLYRIELGRIAISEEGVRYLERSYDLEQYNKPDYFVQRLTAQGEIGIFDERQRLIKYFALGDLTSKEKYVRPEVLDFTVQTLFFEREDDSLELKAHREEWLKEFTEKYFSTFNRRFLEETGVHFNNLSFKEQGGYVHFVATSDDGQVTRAQELIRRHGEAGLRTFISLQFDERLSESIFALDEKLPPEVSRKVFERYAGVIEAVSEIRQFCEEQFRSRPEITTKMVDEIAADLVKKAKEVLVEASQNLESGNDAEAAPNAVQASLQNLRQRVVLMTACFKELSQHVDLSYHDVRGCVMHSCHAEDLPLEFSAQMRSIGRDQILKTYADPAYGRLAFSELIEALESGSHNNFHFVRFGPHVISFCRSHQDEKYQGLYLGSLTTDRHATGGNFGMALAGEVIEQLGAAQPLVALVGPHREKLLKYYQDQFGFRPVDTEPDGTVVIRRDPRTVDELK